MSDHFNRSASAYMNGGSRNPTVSAAKKKDTRKPKQHGKKAPKTGTRTAKSKAPKKYLI